jgi:protocatechuate 3,4-dioxygenase beta subunit
MYGYGKIGPIDNDLTRQHAGEPQGERIIVSGRVIDGSGRPVPLTLVELWQTNAAGRYRHQADQHSAPLDPNFSGAGRALTDHEGRYRFVTIRPGAYPWRNHPNAWRPAHIHFSLFGRNFTTRLVTQMYFPGDPLLPLDPIFNAIPTRARANGSSRGSTWIPPKQSGRSATASTSSCAGRRARRWRRRGVGADAVPDDWPVLPLRPALPRGRDARRTENAR